MPALAPLSGLYGAIVRARLALYRAGVLHTHRIAAPVISVGNITTGGTGKTPLVESLARMVAREGLRVCVLTRGYGRADTGRRVVVSDGERVLASAREGGDEPRLLAEKLLGSAAVLSDADRVAAARWAGENLRSEAFILDDGFQHLRLARDLDLVTLDATAPWGGGHLLPRGRLREPLEGLRRADCIVITRAELAGDLASLRAEVARLCGGRADVIESRVRTVCARLLGRARAEPEAISQDSAEPESRNVPQPVAAFCAIGNPQAFFTHLRRDGHTLTHARAFPDHHPYTQGEIDAFTREAERRGARSLVTTAKDAVKLRAFRFALPVYVNEIVLEFDDEGKLLGRVREALSRGSA
jgi:tetraacyldisaccharide 4'-kinase